jgi:Pyridoxamine 5'-phosphate oxidase
MGKIFDGIDDALGSWIAKQHMFFVATAPREGGHINLSPKGLAASFRILSPKRVAYLDVTGSGAETIAHLKENGRIVVMFCAFEGIARIVRLHGTGRAVEIGTPEYESLKAMAKFPDMPGERAIIDITPARISDSCGYGVPVFEFVSERDQMARWAEKKGEQGLVDYRREKNTKSLDGLPAFSSKP